MNMQNPYGLLIGVVALLGASCTQFEAPAPATLKSPNVNAPVQMDETPVTLSANVDLPLGWDKNAIAEGECMTPIDSVNGAPPSGIPYAASDTVTVIGWNVTSSKSDATPSLIYGVLKPYDQSQNGALLAGTRASRPDVAGDNALYANAGYELSGVLPTAAGRYRFYVWTGIPEAVVECDSKIVLNVE